MHVTAKLSKRMAVAIEERTDVEKVDGFLKMLRIRAETVNVEG